MLVKHGIYTGNDADARDITGVGFDPHLVIIHGSGSGTGSWRTSSFTGDASVDFAGQDNIFTDRIQAFVSDGFTVGTNLDVNASGITYYYMAFRDNGDSDFAYGTYSGTGNDDEDITGAGFDPTFAAVKGAAGGTPGVFKTDQNITTACFGFIDNSATGATRIKSFVTDGFRLGVSSFVNTSSAAYYWFAFKDVANEFNSVTYTGNGNDARDINGTGFQPEIVITKEAGASYGVFRTGDHVGDSSLIGAGSNAADRIEGFIADGFTVGTSGATNESGIVYVTGCWKQVAAPIGGRPLPQRVLSGPFAGPWGGSL